MLSLYELMPCTLLKRGKVNYKVQYTNGKTGYVKPERFAFEDESICVVWMLNKGVEGSYRIERELYPHRRRIAKQYPHQALVWEDSYGVENEFMQHVTVI